MDKILDYIKGVKYEVGVECFTKSKIDFGYTHNVNLQYNIGPNPFESEVEFSYKFSSMVFSELTQHIVKTIFKNILETGKKSFIDLSNINKSQSIYDNQQTKSRKIISKIEHEILQKYLITNGRLSSDYFMDSLSFNSTPISRNIGNTSGLVYSVGKIQLSKIRELWIDPFLRWDDNHVLCFDEIKVDVSNLRHSIHSESGVFAPHILTSLDLKFEVLNPEVFFIFEDGNMKNWDLVRQYQIQEQREERIDYILDDNKESRSDSQFGIYFGDKLES